MFSDPNDPLIQPDVIPLHASSADPILLADPAIVFAERAQRFAQLAAREDGQRTFFEFMAHLSRMQHEAATTFDPGDGPSGEALDLRYSMQMPILPAGLAERDPRWITALRSVLAASSASGDALPPAAAAARTRLAEADDETLDRLAEALLTYQYEALVTDEVAWLAAGLQVYWVVALARLGRERVRPLDSPGVCPCCGSLPVASVRLIGGLQQGLRYLVCSLCATQWHLVRVKCSHCESTKGIGYLTLSSDPDSEAGKAAATREVVKAEVCDECSSYLKIVSKEADANADPVADDLATLALDLLTDARGYLRVGPNLFIHPGSPEA
jgi:FdhE protein